MKRTKKKLIIYDLDGTLVDTREDIVRSVDHMLREHGRDPIPRALIEDFVGSGMQLLIERCLGTVEAQTVESGLRAYERYYAEHMLDNASLYEGVHSLLDYFGSASQGVITNKPDPFSSDMLTALGLGPRLDFIVAGEAVYPRKPDPASTLAMMERASATREEVLFIGDSIIDIHTGKAAGVETVGLTHGFGRLESLRDAGPDWLCGGFPELLALARERGW